MLRVIQQLQEESDTQSGLILDRFLQIRKLESKLVEIQSLNISLMRSSAASRINPNAANASSPVNDAANELVEPRQLDANLLELSLISQRGALFQSFLHERANDDLNNIDEDGTARRIMMNGKDKRYYGDNGLLLTSGLRKRVRELLNSYLVIDAFLMKRNIDKAMTMDEYDPSIAPTSTCVDDVFFILKKVIKRSISTYEPEVITSTVQTVLKTLDNLYIQTFQQKMSMAFAGQELTGRSADRSLDQAKISYMIVLNNLDVSTEYTERLVADLRQDVAAGIWANEKKDMEAATKALDNLAAISKKFQNLLQSRMEQLMAQMLKPRVRPLFQDAYREVKYVLDEEEYNEVEVEELFIKRFRQGFNTLILLYHRTLTENNFRLLLSLLLDVVSVQWEKIVLQTRFNQYGALRFDKDLRTAIHFLSGLTDWLYRDRFTRLSQMATLLNFEEPSEIYECWGAKAGPVSWRLTVTEVKKVLALRYVFFSLSVQRFTFDSYSS
ncbi:COG4 transport protein-domain-containing protein [Radiomyces spectabilis]|uniref:COG4 transport protein-domain-containing protein n=1 Tax=Radiomyces spectabilis TaxID=64574 RepID=UPI0022200B72|nr:COG4 transport protein-domain-containing protein [Radiomyces spectabilis]KAI8373112.1 COG4 transport protein-domain-containing protein [Radiomyces spectabilis]